MITPIVKFLIKLSSKSERNLITIPKIISIINNLLANNNVRDIAVQALKTLSYEIFLMTTSNTTATTITQQQQQQLQQNIQSSPIITAKNKRTLNDPNSLAAIAQNLSTLNNSNELDTQKEVILGMLEKFIESNDCQQVLSLLLLIEQLQQQYEQYKLLNDANKVTKAPTAAATITVVKTIGKATIGDTCIDKQQQQHHQQQLHCEKYTTCLPSVDTVCNTICQSICSNRLYIQDWNDFYMLDTFFKNNTKYLLGNSKEFMSLFKYAMEGVGLKLFSYFI